MNTKNIDYFNLLKYVNNFKLSEEVIDHLGKTNEELDNYLKKLSSYDNASVIYYLLDSLFKDMYYSEKSEGKFVPTYIINDDLFYNKFKLNNELINNIHGKNSNECSYRNGDKKESISFVSPDSRDVSKFMNDYIKLYNLKDNNLINREPFIKSALIHALLVKIQPYEQENYVLARKLNDMKFTDCINDKYKTNFTLAPLHISQSIYYNQLSYLEKLQNIKLDLKEDISYDLNNFINFILSMYDSELFHNRNRMENYNEFLSSLSILDDEDDLIISSSKCLNLSRIRKK